MVSGEGELRAEGALLQRQGVAPLVHAVEADLADGGAVGGELGDERVGVVDFGDTLGMDAEGHPDIRMRRCESALIRPSGWVDAGEEKSADAGGAGARELGGGIGDAVIVEMAVR